MIASQSVRNRMIEESLPIARHIASRFHKPSADDIVQEFALQFESYFLSNYKAEGGQSWETFLRSRMSFFCIDYARRRTNQQVANYQGRGQHTHAVSIHAPINGADESLTIADLLSRDYSDESEQRQVVKDMVKSLDERSRKLFELIYVDGMKQKEAAKRLGMHESRASQLHSEGIALLAAK